MKNIELDLKQLKDPKVSLVEKNILVKLIQEKLSPDNPLKEHYLTYLLYILRNYQSTRLNNADNDQLFLSAAKALLQLAPSVELFKKLFSIMQNFLKHSKAIGEGTVELLRLATDEVKVIDHQSTIKIPTIAAQTLDKQYFYFLKHLQDISLDDKDSWDDSDNPEKVHQWRLSIMELFARFIQFLPDQQKMTHLREMQHQITIAGSNESAKICILIEQCLKYSDKHSRSIIIIALIRSIIIEGPLMATSHSIRIEIKRSLDRFPGGIEPTMAKICETILFSEYKTKSPDEIKVLTSLYAHILVNSGEEHINKLIDNIQEPYHHLSLCKIRTLGKISKIKPLSATLATKIYKILLKKLQIDNIPLQQAVIFALSGLIGHTKLDLPKELLDILVNTLLKSTVSLEALTNIISHRMPGLELLHTHSDPLIKKLLTASTSEEKDISTSALQTLSTWIKKSPPDFKSHTKNIIQLCKNKNTQHKKTGFYLSIDLISQKIIDNQDIEQIIQSMLDSLEEKNIDAVNQSGILDEIPKILENLEEDSIKKIINVFCKKLDNPAIKKILEKLLKDIISKKNYSNYFVKSIVELYSFDDIKPTPLSTETAQSISIILEETAKEIKNTTEEKLNLAEILSKTTDKTTIKTTFNLLDNTIANDSPLNEKYYCQIIKTLSNITDIFNESKYRQQTDIIKNIFEIYNLLNKKEISSNEKILAEFNNFIKKLTSNKYIKVSGIIVKNTQSLMLDDESQEKIIKYTKEVMLNQKSIFTRDDDSNSHLEKHVYRFIRDEKFPLAAKKELIDTVNDILTSDDTHEDFTSKILYQIQIIPDIPLEESIWKKMVSSLIDLIRKHDSYTYDVAIDILKKWSNRKNIQPYSRDFFITVLIKEAKKYPNQSTLSILSACLRQKNLPTQFKKSITFILEKAIRQNNLSIAQNGINAVIKYIKTTESSSIIRQRFIALLLEKIFGRPVDTSSADFISYVVAWISEVSIAELSNQEERELIMKVEIIIELIPLSISPELTKHLFYMLQMASTNTQARKEILYILEKAEPSLLGVNKNKAPSPDCDEKNRPPTPKQSRSDFFTVPDKEAKILRTTEDPAIYKFW